MQIKNHLFGNQIKSASTSMRATIYTYLLSVYSICICMCIVCMCMEICTYTGGAKKPLPLPLFRQLQHRLSIGGIAWGPLTTLKTRRTGSLEKSQKCTSKI